MERAEQISTIKKAWENYRKSKSFVLSIFFDKDELTREFLAKIDFPAWKLSIENLENEYDYFECEDCENEALENEKLCKNCMGKNKGSEINQNDYHNLLNFI